MANLREVLTSVALGACLLSAGCATVPTDPAAREAYDEANDPLEPLNRGIFEFNRVLDGLILKNVAELYRLVLPDEVRTGIRNVLNNMNEPVVFANNLLQGETDRAGTTAVRFAVNSTVGIGGLFDWAKDWGYKRQSGDFGQTLWSWGTPEGPYLMLPLLGPSNPRDGVGELVDGYIDPFRYVFAHEHVKEGNQARFIVDGIDRRSRVIEELDNIEKTSIDYYAQIRSLWRQMRQRQLEGDTVETYKGTPAGEDFYKDPAKTQ